MEILIFYSIGYIVNIVLFIIYAFFIKTTYIWETSINNDHKWVVMKQPIIGWLTLLLPLFIPYLGVVVYPIVYTFWVNFLKDTCGYSIRYANIQCKIRCIFANIRKIVCYPFKILFIEI